MLCAFVVIRCEGSGYIADLRDYLENNKIIAHFCGYDITRPLLSYWTTVYKKLENSIPKEIIASMVQKLFELGVVDVSFVLLYKCLEEGVYQWP